MTSQPATFVSRHIAELIDTTLGGDNVVITRYGHSVAQFTSAIPEDNEILWVSMTSFLATVGRWLTFVKNGSAVVLTRRNRPVVAVVPLAFPTS